MSSSSNKNGQDSASIAHILRNVSGTLSYYQDNKLSVLHRTDGPARIFMDGTQEWYQNGVRHRTDGPAIESFDGTQEWWVNGKRHRTDGPAYTRKDGVQEWYQNGVKHRVDGPAVLRDDYEIWFFEGEIHRLDGPAMVEKVLEKRRFWFRKEHVVEEWWLFGEIADEATYRTFQNILNEQLSEKDILAMPYSILKEIYCSSNIVDESA